MRIAVVGSGIAGLVSSWLLHREHELTLFESSARLGGHSCTVDVREDGRVVPVDMGFIVFNERTYPNFVGLLKRWGVDWDVSDMSFSVRDERTGLEYSGSGLNGLFAQRRNLLRPQFLRMVRDILRFYRQASEVLEEDEELSLGDYLRRKGFGDAFVEQHLLPMGAAVWSCPPERMLGFPACTFVRFFHNHGFLQVGGRPRWLTLPGGARRYVERIAGDLGQRVRAATPVRAVRREPSCVRLRTDAGWEDFDGVVLATHGDQALRLLEDPDEQERAILGAIPYQRNEVVLHTDESVLPSNHRARSSWNYHLLDGPGNRASVAVTYWMNRLQAIPGPTQFCVSLNRNGAIAPERVIARRTFDHPVFTARGIRAQGLWERINGPRRTWYAGAWWGFGFHEDGVNSALRVARGLGVAA